MNLPGTLTAQEYEAHETQIIAVLAAMIVKDLREYPPVDDGDGGDTHMLKEAA